MGGGGWRVTTDDRIPFAKAFAALCVTHGEPATEERVALYFAALEELPIEAVTAACWAAIRTRKFFPKPAELRELAGAGLPDVGLVEAMLFEHFRYGRNYRRVPDDPFLRLVVERLGGVAAVTGMDAAARIFALAKILPGVVTAATARGIALPSEASAALSLAAQEASRRALDASTTGAAPYETPPERTVEPRRTGTGTVADFVAAYRKRDGGK